MGPGGGQGAHSLHDGTGRQWVSDVACAGCPTVLAEGLIATAVSVTAPLHGVGGKSLGGKSVEDACVHCQGSQSIVSEQYGLPLAGGAGDELVLRAGLIEDLQALLTYRVQTGEDARTFVSEVVHVPTGRALQRLTRGGRVQHVLVHDHLIRWGRWLAMVADLRAAFALSLVEPFTPGERGCSGQSQGCWVTV